MIDFGCMRYRDGIFLIGSCGGSATTPRHLTRFSLIGRATIVFVSPQKTVEEESLMPWRWIYIYIYVSIGQQTSTIDTYYIFSRQNSNTRTQPCY